VARRLGFTDREAAMDTESTINFASATSMDHLYRLLAKAKMENGWAKPEPSMWPLPRRQFIPAHWRYADAKPALDAAGRFVNTELAERRNLILANPIPDNHYPTVRTLVAAYQMVKAGETARSHRHSANALRLVLDAQKQAYTIVEGRKIPMEPGDVLLTPNWSWHGHANESPANAYWIDFLDLPLVHLLGPMFFEHHPDGLQAATEVAAQSPARFAWAQTCRQLDDQAETSSGWRTIELGAPALASINLHVWRLEPTVTATADPTTANQIFAVMQGAGSAAIDAETFRWRRGDILAVPTGSRAAFCADEQSHLLRVSDEPLLRQLRWLRGIPMPQDQLSH
jgi:gentisate 1,2-dioxygenase